MLIQIFFCHHNKYYNNRTNGILFAILSFDFTLGSCFRKAPIICDDDDEQCVVVKCLEPFVAENVSLYQTNMRVKITKLP